MKCGFCDRVMSGEEQLDRWTLTTWDDLGDPTGDVDYCDPVCLMMYLAILADEDEVEKVWDAKRLRVEGDLERVRARLAAAGAFD